MHVMMMMACLMPGGGAAARVPCDGDYVVPSHEPPALQSFLKVYETLRDELISDPCLTNPEESKQTKEAQLWFKEVTASVCACALAAVA